MDEDLTPKEEEEISATLQQTCVLLRDSERKIREISVSIRKSTTDVNEVLANLRQCS